MYLIRQSSYICFLMVVVAEGWFAESSSNQVLLDPQTFGYSCIIHLFPLTCYILFPYIST